MSEELWGSIGLNNLQKNQISTFETNPDTPHEVFRNDTTAVEIIVKQNKNKKKLESSKHSVTLEQINNKLIEDIENLKNELNKAQKNTEDIKKCFKMIMFEMAKQLEAANKKELKLQTKYIVQQLEKEKLKTILECKTNLVKRLQKELLYVKRMTKIVIKGVRCIPLFETSDLSELEYTDFENDIKNKDINNQPSLS